MRGYRTRPWWLVVTLVLVGLVVAGGGANAGFYWQPTTVDSASAVGESTSIALDSSDHPHISYLDVSNGDLKYAWWDGTTWQITTVDGADAVGSDTSLALDSSDHPHISYYDVRHNDLGYASLDDSGWQITTVDSDGDVGEFASLALDSSGHPHISYRDKSNEDLKYAWWDGSSWHTTTVDSDGDVGWKTSIALDANDHPHISYWDKSNGDLKYASLDDSGWQTTTVDSGGNVGEYTSLALDSSGYPHISYYDVSNGDLKYAWWDGTTWQTTTVDSGGDVGTFPSLALDSSDHPHISYWDFSNFDLKYASWNGSTWHTTTVDSDGIVGQYTSLALDSSDAPHISYYDFDNGDLKYADPAEDPAAPTTTATATTADQQPYTFDSWTNQSVSVTLSATDTGGSGLAETFYTLNGGTAQTYTNTPIAITAEGITTLTFWSTDHSGNEESPHAVSIKIDRTPPTITFTGNAGTYTIDQTVQIHCEASDDLSGVATTDCQDITGPALSFGVGDHTFSHTATDHAGNVGQNSVSFTVAATADSLCALTQQYERNPLNARRLCLPLTLAALGQRLHSPLVERAGVTTYILLVSVERGRGLTPDEADTLIRLAHTLE